MAKGRLSVDPDALDLTAVDSADGLAECGVVIEAIIEDLAVKRALFAELEAVVASDAILASNTSSLSPTALAAGLAHPERLVGLHFFNPVPAMKLVEVISGLATAPHVARRRRRPGHRLGQDRRPVHRHPGVHRQPDRPPLSTPRRGGCTRSTPPLRSTSTPCSPGPAASAWGRSP